MPRETVRIEEVLAIVDRLTGNANHAMDYYAQVHDKEGIARNYGRYLALRAVRQEVEALSFLNVQRD